MKSSRSTSRRGIAAILVVAVTVGACTNTTSQARKAICENPAPIGNPEGELTDLAPTQSGPIGAPSIKPTPVEGSGAPFLYYSSNESGQFQIYKVRATLAKTDSASVADSKLQLTDSGRDQGSSNVTPYASSLGYITFSSNRTGNYEIFVMRADGSGQTRLTNTPGNELGPVLSPDGRAVAFSSDCYGNEDIFVASTNGQSIKRITASPANETAPDWSPDGSTIAFRSDTDGLEAIYLANSDGQNPRRLTNNDYPESAPAFSPDGTSIAFQAKKGKYWQIHILRFDSGEESVVSDGKGNDFRPRWSLDGSKLYFVSDRDGHDAIYVMNADGSAVTLLAGDSYEARNPSEALA